MSANLNDAMYILLQYWWRIHQEIDRSKYIKIDDMRKETKKNSRNSRNTKEKKGKK